MKSLLAATVVLLVADRAAALSIPVTPYLPASIEQVASNLDTFDPVTFTPGHFVDVYHVVLSNPNPAPVDALELSFPGSWVNNASTGLTFKDTPDLPFLGPYTVAETFFLRPPGVYPLDVVTIDNNTLLGTTSPFFGTIPLVPAQDSAVVAVLSTPTGTLLDLSPFSGRAFVEGVFESIIFVPEPTTAWLMGLGIAGVLSGVVVFDR